MEYVKVGSIIKTRGLKGEVRIYPTSDFRDFRFQIGNKLYLYHPESDTHQPLTIEKRLLDGALEIITFKEINSIEEAEKLVGLELHALKQKDILPDGGFFFGDLLDLSVIDEDGNFLGKVKKIEEYSAYKTLRVSREGNKDFFVPFVETFIKKVDLTNGQITIHVLEGLL